MKKLLLVFLIPFILGCKRISASDHNFKDGKVTFVSVEKTPIVKGTLNGKEAYFIIDSGASISVLDDNQADDYLFTLGYSEGDISGYGGQSSPRSTSEVDINIGGVDFSFRLGLYRSQDIQNVVDAIKENGGIEIVGIIGSNVMKDLGIIIDYSSNALYIKDYVTIQPK